MMIRKIIIIDYCESRMNWGGRKLQNPCTAAVGAYDNMWDLSARICNSDSQEGTLQDTEKSRNRNRKAARKTSWRHIN
jgi:hypothetical protein